MCIRDSPLPPQETTDNILEFQESSSLAEQLGKRYTETQVFLKTQTLYIAHFRGKAKKKSERMSSLQSALDYVSTITVSRLTLASCLAQCFDYSGRHLSLVRVYLKTALRRHVQGGGTQWDSAITGSNLELFYSALRCFFMVCQLSLIHISEPTRPY